jgi:2-aminoadipate transaminase
MKPTMQTSFGFSQRARRSHKQPIGYLMAQAVTNPSLISLAAGLVDYDTLPGDDSAEVLGELLRDGPRSRAALQYGTTEGLTALREALLSHMADLDGVSSEELGCPEDMIIATGSQELLYLVTNVLVDPGDIVITGWPSYFVYTGTLESAGASVRCVDMDAYGMIPEALEEVFRRIEREGNLPRVKIVYVVDYHQNPTGLTLSQERRPQILDIVRRYSRDNRILLLEDSAYRELTYEGDAPHSIRRYDEDGQAVAVVQTFSKPFSPGMKTGYGLLPRDLVEPVLIQKGNIDFGSNNLVQHLLLEAIRRGQYARHVEKLRRAYARKRDAMLEALDEELGDFQAADTHWTKPSGGLYVFVTLPSHIDTGTDGALFARCLEEGMLYVPGEFCFGPDPTRDKPRSTLRLSFGVANVEQIREGIRRFGRAVRAAEG